MRGSELAPTIDTATWVFVVMSLPGVAFSPEEGADLVVRPKVEADVLLSLFFLMAPRWQRKPGEIEAHLNSG